MPNSPHFHRVIYILLPAAAFATRNLISGWMNPLARALSASQSLRHWRFPRRERKFPRAVSEMCVCGIRDLHQARAVMAGPIFAL